MIFTAPSSPAPSAASGFVVRRPLAVWLAVLACFGAWLASSASALATTPSLYLANSFGFGHPDRLTGYVAGAAATPRR